jgi:hypothetical protein
LDLSAGGINIPDRASGYRQAARFSQVIKPCRVATLSGLGDRIGRPAVRQLAEPPPKMSGENIPIDREAKLQSALTTRAPSAGIEYP